MAGDTRTRDGGAARAVTEVDARDRGRARSVVGDVPARVLEERERHGGDEGPAPDPLRGGHDLVAEEAAFPVRAGQRAGASREVVLELDLSSEFENLGPRRQNGLSHAEIEDLETVVHSRSSEVLVNTSKSPSGHVAENGPPEVRAALASLTPINPKSNKQLSQPHLTLGSRSTPEPPRPRGASRPL